MIPTWKDHQSAGAEQRSRIERLWRNAWHSDEAYRLLIRAAHLRTEAAGARYEAGLAAWAATIEVSGPPGGYRRIDNGPDRDTLVDRNTAHAQGWGWPE